MGEISKVFILDNIKSVRSRLKLLLSTKNFNVLEASTSHEFFNIFSKNKYNGDLIIIDIELKDEDGFKVIREIRDKNKTIPIIILTANNHRETFIKGIFHGATDYVLKPFDDLLLKDKIYKVLASSNNENEVATELIFNLPFFLHSEFLKSKKGKYSTSVMMTTLFKPVNLHSNEIESEYITLSNIVYDELKGIFWDTDIFTKYGSQSFIGVFPFASKLNIDMILTKINQRFKDLKENNNKLNDYFLANEFISYPEDIMFSEDVTNGNEIDAVILTLIDKTKEAIRLSKENLLKNKTIEK